MALGWEGVRAEVTQRIQSRIWPQGALIPSEAVLALEFGCARATVNRALTELADAGILERKRRAGTRVARLPVRKATLDIPVIRAEVQARGQVYAFALISMGHDLPPLTIAARLRLPQGRRMIHLRTLHLADGQPHVVEDRWLSPAVLPDPAPDFAAISANEWLVANVAYAAGDIAFYAEAATADEAAALSVPLGQALFITERCTWGSDDGPITWVRLAHAPGYRLQTAI